MRSAVVVAFVLACRSPAPVVVVDAAPASSCASVVASYDGLVASGGACASDGDCECFQGGVSPKSACGGVTDRATAAKLETLRADYEHGACDALSCAGWVCTPACRAGKCVSASDVAAAPSASAPSASWTTCSSDADCTYVSLGCCDTTPVNRAHVADAKRKLERSGRPYCPPKTACGPSADGTWAGAPGKCSGGSCVLRSM